MADKAFPMFNEILLKVMLNRHSLGPMY